MPSRPAVPAPKPLTVRAAAYIRAVNAAEAKRQQDIQTAVNKALAAAAPVYKAKAKSDQVAAYDADGNLIGVVDPEDITPIAAAQAPGKPQAAAQSAPAQQAPAAPADGAVPAAKAMSAGAEKRGAHQLGGPTPRGGVPVTPAEDEDAEVAKARVQVLSAELKKSLNGGVNCSAVEASRVAEMMQAAALARFQEMQRQGRAPGAPRRP